MTGAELALPFVGDLAGKVVDVLSEGALQKLLSGRMREARERLMKEVAKGKPWVITDDEATAALFAYFNAAREGAARINLQMIAEALAAGASEPTFAPDTFRRHAGDLASLSRDEVLVLAAFHRANGKAASQPDSEKSVRSSAWALMRDQGWTGLPQSLDIYAAITALGRTGWVSSASGFGSLIYYTTASFEEIARLVDLQAAQNASSE